MITMSDLKRSLDREGVVYEDSPHGILMRQRAKNSNDVFTIVIELDNSGYAYLHVLTYNLGKYVNENLKELINSLNVKWNFFKFFYIRNNDDGSYNLFLGASAIVKENNSCDENS